MTTQSALAAVAEAAAGQTSPRAQTSEAAGVAQHDHDAAVTQAKAEGHKEGATAERTRLTTILASDGVAGNAARMSHALELAAGAPEMSSEQVVGLTTKHVPEAAASGSGLSLSERSEDADPIGASAGAGAETPKAGIDVNAIYQVHNGTR